MHTNMQLCLKNQDINEQKDLQKSLQSITSRNYSLSRSSYIFRLSISNFKIQNDSKSKTTRALTYTQQVIRFDAFQVFGLGMLNWQTLRKYSFKRTLKSERLLVARISSDTQPVEENTHFERKYLYVFQFTHVINWILYKWI